MVLSTAHLSGPVFGIGVASGSEAQNVRLFPDWLGYNVIEPFFFFGFSSGVTERVQRIAILDVLPDMRAGLKHLHGGFGYVEVLCAVWFGSRCPSSRDA